MRQISPTVVDQTDALTASSAMISGLQINSYSDDSLNTPYTLQWQKTMTCDLTMWTSATACNGVDKPWAFGKITPQQTTPTVKSGSVTAWHFLADVGADPSKTFSIEKSDTLQVFLYEFIDKKAPIVGAATPCWQIDQKASADGGSANSCTAAKMGGATGLATDVTGGCTPGAVPADCGNLWSSVYQYAWHVEEVIVSGAAANALGFAALAILSLAF
jgi:hypothetical protein